MSACRPSAVPHTTAWSGVSSHARPALSTTCCIERDCSMVFWRVRRYAASIARTMAPGIVTRGMLRANNMMTTPPAMAAPPITTSPEAGRFAPSRIAAPPATIARRPLATAGHHATRLLDDPATLDHVVFQGGVEPRHARSELGQLVGLDEAFLPVAERPQVAKGVVLSRPDRLARVALAASSTGSPVSGMVSTPTLWDIPSSPLSSRNVRRPPDARSSIAVVKARRDSGRP